MSNVRAAAVATLAELVPHKGDEEVQSDFLKKDCTATFWTFSDSHTWHHMHLKLVGKMFRFLQLLIPAQVQRLIGQPVDH